MLVHMYLDTYVYKIDFRGKYIVNIQDENQFAMKNIKWVCVGMKGWKLRLRLGS